MGFLNLFKSKNGLIYSDSKSGLIWTKDGNISGKEISWNEAVLWVKNLDYAGYRDWRLPTVDEFFDFIDRAEHAERKCLSPLYKVYPAQWLNSNGFNNVRTGRYWTSNSCLSSSGKDCAKIMSTTGIKGKEERDEKIRSHSVWPVRGYR